MVRTESGRTTLRTPRSKTRPSPLPMAVTPSGMVTVPEVAVQRTSTPFSMIKMESSWTGVWVGAGSWDWLGF